MSSMIQSHEEAFEEFQKELKDEAEMKRDKKPLPKEKKPDADAVLPVFPPRKAKETVKIAKAYKAGGVVGSASKRADGCAQRGKTKGRMV